MSKKIILLSGIAGSGKDTFFHLASEMFPNIFERFAFADELKKELSGKIKKDYDIDIFSCSREEKEKVRELLISHGMKRREESQGEYWVKKITPWLKACKKMPIITDFRFLNERTLLSKSFETYSIHIETFCPKRGICFSPSIPEEIENNPSLKLCAEDNVFWPDSKGNISLLKPYVMESIIKIKKKWNF